MNLLDRIKAISSGAYSTHETLINTLTCASTVLAQQIPGDFVECGVAAGSQIAMMEVAIKLHHDRTKMIHAFDSFEGIPLASLKDDQQPGIGNIKPEQVKPELKDRLVSSGITVHNLPSVIRNLASWECNCEVFKFHQGWFQNTLPRTQVGPISLLRLDGDLYESTQVCLEYLYPRMSPGAILIIDDWALLGCRRACDEYFKTYTELYGPYPVANSTPVWFIKK